MLQKELRSYTAINEKHLILHMAGESFTAVTPTASGKSLCYHLPVLQSILEDESSRAIYLFPTKALAQDQLG